MSQLPVELYNECISYLWDDKKSLSACSLAGRTLTVTSQKLLFYQIILHSSRHEDGKETRRVRWGGSSAAFHKLLESSPHLAEYVQCLQIFNSNDADCWLPKDSSLPLFPPLLCNIKALVIFSVPDWDVFSEQVRCRFQDLIQRPSLVYVDISPRPAFLFNQSFTNNLRYLIMRDPLYGSLPQNLIPFEPIYLETLFMQSANPTFMTALTSDPNFRFKTTQLKRLLLGIKTDPLFYHSTLWPLLHSCRKTLEHFTFIPRFDSELLSEADLNTPRSPPIDLSQMTALKTLILYFTRVSSDWDSLWPLNNLLQSASSVCQQLEEITVVFEMFGVRYIGTPNCDYWDATCDVLLDPNRCPRLRKVNIHALDIAGSAGSGAPTFRNSLERSKRVEKLRARPGLELVITVERHVNVLKIAPDKRWENYAFL